MRIAILILMCASACAAQQPNTLTAAEKAAGWRLLFDGKSMRGWHDPASKTPPGKSWVIENGCLKAVAKPGLREDLITEESFSDFELTFEWRIGRGGNSGLKYLIQDEVLLDADKLKPGAKRFEDMVVWELENRRGDRSNPGPQGRIEAYVISFEYQLIDDSAHLDAARGPRFQAGSLYGLIPPSSAASKPIGEFNSSRLVVRGKHVEHWLNGLKVVDAMLDSEEVRAGLAKRWQGTRVYELLTTLPRKKCPFALQHHNDEAWFRSIKVRSLGR